MAKRMFEVNTSALFSSEAFIGATRDELRVLVAVMADRAATDEAIAEAAGVSAARCRSALTLFEEEKILTRTAAVEEEFEAPIDEPDEDSAVQVASDIRDRGLASLISNFAALLQKPALSTGQVKKLVALNTNYSLSEEFLLTLGAHLADRGKLTVTRLVNEAIKLVEHEIDTPEALCAYIEQKRMTTEANIRMRRILGINGRAITNSERVYFEKWINEFGFSDQIIAHAYDIMFSNINKYHPKYMDHILTRWQDSGCKTLADCIEQNERDRAALAAEATAKKSSVKNPTKKQTDTTPKYGAFSAEDALMRALERSYGSEDN